MVGHARDHSLIDEDWHIRDIWLRVCSESLTHIFRDLGCWRAGNPGAIVNGIGADLDSSYVWLNSERQSKKRNEVILNNFRYDPDLGKREWGTVRTVSEEVVDDGRSWTLDATGFDEDTVFEKTYSYRLRKSESEGLTQSYKASTSISHKTSAEAQVKAGPASASAKTETSVNISFEASAGVDRQEGIDEETTDTIKQPIPVKKGHRVQAYVEKTKLITERPYSIHGVLDFDIHVDLENWAGKDRNGSLWTDGYNRNRISFEGVNGFRKFLSGYDPRFPRMAGYAAVCGRVHRPAIEAWDWLENPAHRTVSAEGVRRREFENNAHVAVRNLAN